MRARLVRQVGGPGRNLTHLAWVLGLSLQAQTHFARRFPQALCPDPILLVCDTVLWGHHQHQPRK